MKKPHLHASHGPIARRLRRVEGHVRSIVAMIEEGRPCLDLAMQLHAVERAISEAKRTLIQDHIDHCLDYALEAPSAQQQRRAVAEFKKLSRYL